MELKFLCPGKLVELTFIFLFLINIYIYIWSIIDLKCFRFTGGDSVIYIHTYYFYISFHYRLLQDIDDGNLLFLVSSLTFQSTTRFGSSFLLLFGDCLSISYSKNYKIKRGDWDDRVRGCRTHLLHKHIKDTKYFLRWKNVQWKLNWRVAEGLLNSQGCKKDSESSREAVRLNLCLWEGTQKRRSSLGSERFGCPSPGVWHWEADCAWLEGKGD